MEAVPVIAWFRTRKQLHARNAELEDILAKRADELVEVRRDANERVEEVQESLRLAHRAMNTQRRLRIEAEERLAAHEAKNAQLVEELRCLRDDIARREQAEAEALTYMPVRGFGMARYADTELHEFIADDAAHVRREDI